MVYLLSLGMGMILISDKVIKEGPKRFDQSTLETFIESLTSVHMVNALTCILWRLYEDGWYHVMPVEGLVQILHDGTFICLEWAVDVISIVGIVMLHLWVDDVSMRCQLVG